VAAEPFAATKGLSLKAITRRAVLNAEREVIRRALEQCRWNRVKTARMLKISSALSSTRSRTWASSRSLPSTERSAT
jgi:DNA-binding NtrC family response regulator